MSHQRVPPVKTAARAATDSRVRATTRNTARSATRAAVAAAIGRVAYITSMNATSDEVVASVYRATLFETSDALRWSLPGEPA